MKEHTYRPHLVVEPGTRLGRASLLTFGAAIVLLVLSITLGPRGVEFFDEPLWAAATIGWVAATLASFVASVVAIFRQGERSIVTFVIVALLALPVGWIVFELTVPHSN